MEVEHEKLVPIEGNTYAVKEELKKIGARWFKELKQWRIPISKIEEANEIVKNGAKSAPTQKRFHYRKCQVCGAEAGRYFPIYASGECRDCYEERKMGY
jgi:hypothetical protein